MTFYRSDIVTSYFNRFIVTSYFNGSLTFFGILFSSFLNFRSIIKFIAIFIYIRFFSIFGIFTLSIIINSDLDSLIFIT